MISKQKMAALGAAVLLPSLLAGCGAAAENSGVSAATNQPLVIVQSPEGTYSENFNPFSSGALNGTLGPIYQTLFYFNLIGTNSVPLLATSYAWSNNATTLTVNLRHGVQWSNGQPFTSSDVVYTFNLLHQDPALDANGIWKSLVAVQANGKYQVVFRFSKPSIGSQWWILGQTYILPQKIWSQIKNPATYTNANPVGTGPYLLHSFSPQEYTFTANPHYWGGEPKVHTLEFPAYTSNDSADLALASGKIDWAGIFIPNAKQVYESRNPANNHFWFPPVNIVMLYTNLKNPLLAQLPVREAISYAINREKLYKVGEYGYEPPASPTGLVLPNNQAWLAPNLPQKDLAFQYDPQKSIQILQQAGFKKNSQGIFVSPAGQPLSFTLNVVAGWTDWDTDCSLIAQELGKVGIQIHVNQEQFGAYYSAFTNGTYQLGISWTDPGPTPYYLYSALLSSNSSANWEGWNNTQTNNALQAYQSAETINQQKQDIYPLEKIMATDLPSIPLVEGATWYEYNTKNFTGWPTPQNPYVEPAPYYYPSMGIILTHLRPKG